MTKENDVWEDSFLILGGKNPRVIIFLIVLAFALIFWISGAIPAFLNFTFVVFPSLLANNFVLGLVVFLIILLLVLYLLIYIFTAFFWKPIRVSSKWMEISDVKWNGPDVLLFFNSVFGLKLIAAGGRMTRIANGEIRQIEVFKPHRGYLNYYVRISDQKNTYLSTVFDLSGFTYAIKKNGMEKKITRIYQLVQL